MIKKRKLRTRRIILNLVKEYNEIKADFHLGEDKNLVFLPINDIFEKILKDLSATYKISKKNLNIIKNIHKKISNVVYINQLPGHCDPNYFDGGDKSVVERLILLPKEGFYRVTCVITEKKFLLPEFYVSEHSIFCYKKS